MSYRGLHVLVAGHRVYSSDRLVALVLLVGSITAFDIRILRMAMRQVPVSRVGERLWTWGAFGVSLITGVLMFILASAPRVRSH